MSTNQNLTDNNDDKKDVPEMSGIQKAESAVSTAGSRTDTSGSTGTSSAFTAAGTRSRLTGTDRFEVFVGLGCRRIFF